MGVKVEFEGMLMEFANVSDAAKVLAALGGSSREPGADRAVQVRRQPEAAPAKANRFHPRSGSRVEHRNGTTHNKPSRRGEFSEWPLWLAILKLIVRDATPENPINVATIRKRLGYRSGKDQTRFGFMSGASRAIAAVAKAQNWDGEPLICPVQSVVGETPYRNGGKTAYVPGKNASVFLARMEKRLGLA